MRCVASIVPHHLWLQGVREILPDSSSSTVYLFSLYSFQWREDAVSWAHFNAYTANQLWRTFISDISAHILSLENILDLWFGQYFPNTLYDVDKKLKISSGSIRPSCFATKKKTCLLKQQLKALSVIKKAYLKAYRSVVQPLIKARKKRRCCSCDGPSLGVWKSESKVDTQGGGQTFGEEFSYRDAPHRKSNM